MRTFAVCALGCRVNQYDAEAMREQLLSLGYEQVEFSQKADVYLIATCTVTGTSDKKSRQMINRAHRKNPDALIVAAGCLAQREGEALLQIPGVGLVIGSSNRAMAGQLVEEALAGMKKSAVEELDTVFEPLAIGQMHGRTRVALKIQEGCDRFCSYCIIPYVRGPIRSRALADCVEEAKRLAAHGVPEIVLTGIHLTSYGRDLGRQAYPGQLLAELLEQLNAIEGVHRIRMGSLEPSVLSEEFMARVAKLDKFAHQMHVALQSGSETVLRRMKRSYTKDGYARHIDILRKYWPDAAISTDMIAGFPGETEDEAKETIEFVRRIGFSHLHVFPYSPREGTPAAVMEGQLSTQKKQARAAQLIAVGEELKKAYIEQFDGTVQDVLFERERDGIYIGRTGEDIEVVCDTPQPFDRLVSCKLTLQDDVMHAQVL